MSYTPTIWKTGDVITAQKLNKMESAIHTILSDYSPTNWVYGDIITAEKLNKLENAIEYVNFEYVKTIWKNDDIITASLLNNMENGIEIASTNKTWEEMNWNDIIIATRTGKYKNFVVGDTKEISLGTEGVINMQIVSIDVDDLADETGKAPLTFISRELLLTSHRMNPALSPSSPPYTNATGAVGGWNRSEGRSYLATNILPLIPQTIQDAIKTVTKHSNAYNTSGSLVENDATDDKLWIPSYREIFGDDTCETTGPVYDIFDNIENRRKQKPGGSSAVVWFLRSARDVGYFWAVKANGETTYSTAGDYGIAVGFCL